MDPFLLLAAAEGAGPGLISQLLDPFEQPLDLLANPPDGTPPAAKLRCRDLDTLARRARAWVDDATRLGIAVLTPSDPRYPQRMRDAPLRPAMLYARGDLNLLRDDRPTLAVVGSRTPTAYGMAAAQDFAGALAQRGVVLWSGLAAGIDAAAHRACLAAGTPTVAVLAGGLDTVYPAGHLALFEQIATRGGLCLSELPPRARPQRGHFPRRNRILALCARGVLVVEAGLASGSLHTAQFGADAGVPVYAVPGPYTSERSRGCHRLLADGALVAADPEVLLRDLEVATTMDADHADQQPARGIARSLSADEQAIVQVLAVGPRPCDLVRRECRLESAHFLIALDSLIDSGRVLELEGDLLALTAAR